ncbi:MAG: metallophosphoesterase [Desulfobacterales bacterium]|nr:metallophosphoesterase [Desulfobacterales bacterium]
MNQDISMIFYRLQFLNQKDMLGKMISFTEGLINGSLDYNDGKSLGTTPARLLKIQDYLDKTTPEQIIQKITSIEIPKEYEYQASELISTLEESANLHQKFIENLTSYRDALVTNDIAKTIVFSDKHGKSGDLRRILKIAINAAKNGEALEIISIGDNFDRGSENKENFDILLTLKKISRRYPSVKFHSCLGNHDIMLIKAVLLDKDYLDYWMSNGGESVITEFKAKGANIRHLALWILVNSRLFYVDRMKWLYIHAGIPCDIDGNALITQKLLNQWQNELSLIQNCIKTEAHWLKDEENKNRVLKLFKDSDLIFWIGRHDWLFNFSTASQNMAFQIDDENKLKLFNWIKNNCQADEVNEDWKKILMNYRSVLKKNDIRFRVISPARKIHNTKTQLFLSQLYINGVFFGHEHLGNIQNTGDTFFCIDTDEYIEGHLTIDDSGIWFNGRDTYEMIVSRDKLIHRVNKQLQDIDGR